jgi:hypothetical protein
MVQTFTSHESAASRFAKATQKPTQRTGERSQGTAVRPIEDEANAAGDRRGGRLSVQVGNLSYGMLPTGQQPVAEHVVQLVDGVDLPPRLFDRVLDAAERDLLVLENGIAGPRIAVPRLAH